MNNLKAFMAGAAFPAMMLPFIYTAITNVPALNNLQYLPLHFVPLAWGLWNMVQTNIPLSAKDVNTRYWLSGATLGFLFACLAVFVYDISTLLELEGNLGYFPLIGTPLVWSIFWRYIVKAFNQEVGINGR